MHDEPPLMRGDDAQLPAGFIRECIVMGAFVLLVCVSLSASSVLRRADLLFFDIVQRLLLLRPSPHKIVLIAIDSASAHAPTRQIRPAATCRPGASVSNSSAGCSGSVASGSNSTAVGNSSTASGNDSTALGAGSNDGGRSNVVAVGSADSARQVVNVAAGRQGTDAVNVNQLNAVSNQFTQSLNTVNNQLTQMQRPIQQTDSMPREGSPRRPGWRRFRTWTAIRASRWGAARRRSRAGKPWQSACRRASRRT